MKKEITLPKISEGDEKGLVAEVYVSKGDQVSAEDSILAVESDKATVDIPLEESGTILELKVKEGDEVASGDLLLILEIEDENENDEGDNDKDETKHAPAQSGDETKHAPAKARDKDRDRDRVADEEKDKDKDKTEHAPAQAGDKDKDKDTDKTKHAPAPAGDKDTDPAQEEDKEEDNDRERDRKSERDDSDTDDPNVRATPLVRELARELGIGLEDILAGKSGSDRQITRDDLFAFVKDRMKGGASEAEETPELPDFSQWGETERQSLSPVRRKVAEVTRQAWTTIPHVTNHEGADVTGLNEQLEKLEGEVKITLTTVVIKILSEALRKFPRFNSSFDATREELILKKYVNIAVAVDTESGLFMPVIREADQKALTRLAEDLRELAGKARDQKLDKKDMEGGNFAVSNLGGIGGALFTPVIFPPHVAILGMSRMRKEARWTGSEFIPRDILPLSLSYDHRVIDGADAARFLDYVRKALENPLKLIS